MQRVSSSLGKKDLYFYSALIGEEDTGLEGYKKPKSKKKKKKPKSRKVCCVVRQEWVGLEERVPEHLILFLPPPVH